MGKKSLKAALHRHWVHSHEEDNGSERVYRPVSFTFPPSRGRTSFELHPDGTMIEHAPGPTDRGQDVPGTWTFAEGDALLEFSASSSAGQRRVMRIVSAGKNKLVLKDESS
jgi:hypothetical protein